LKMVPELGVLQGPGMLLLVLLPQMLQRHPYAFQLQNKKWGKCWVSCRYLVLYSILGGSISQSRSLSAIS